MTFFVCFFWFLQLEPIVDTISEHEKYGNNGDMFDGIARSIVNGYEAFSNLLNALIQVSKAFILTILKYKETSIYFEAYTHAHVFCLHTKTYFDILMHICEYLLSNLISAVKAHNI